MVQHRPWGGVPLIRRRPGPRQLSVRLAVPLALVLAAAPLAVPAPAVAAKQTSFSGIGVDPADLGSMSAVTRLVGAQRAWAQGWTGKGVDVALIDTGVARVPGLDQSGQVIDGPDLSFDAATGGPFGVDAYGHGTFLAGIIAGRDAGVTASSAGCTTCLNSSGFSTTAAYVGVAPESRIVNVKVGAADGGADVTQLIAAVDWVTQHAHDPGLNIRVLNLSYGATSAQSAQLDPLAQAVEQAWKHGIVVVVSAGNDGKAAPELASPAYDPFVQAVGGLDPGTRFDTSDDKVARFANHGTAGRPVDVLAPAVSLIGLRVPGGYVDSLSTNTGKVGDRFQRGSGTSQAAAVVSGVAALVLQRYPNATPDQVKALLDGTATPLPRANLDPNDPRSLWYSGHGVADTAAALAAPLPSTASATQNFAAATGAGTLDATRNGVFVNDGVSDLTGQRDVFGQSFDSVAMAARQVSANAWSGGNWNANRWSGAALTPSGWNNLRWDGASWSGIPWNDVRWNGLWDGVHWGGVHWGGVHWGGVHWGGSTWDSARWSLNGWN